MLQLYGGRGLVDFLAARTAALEEVLFNVAVRDDEAGWELLFERDGRGREGANGGAEESEGGGGKAEGEAERTDGWHGG